MKNSSKRRMKYVPPRKSLPFECIALVLQGGGALGSYQAGVYEALAEAELEPTWVAGISIGAINAAIIAGNEPKDRVAKLKGFWEAITDKPWVGWANDFDFLKPRGDVARTLFNKMSAEYTVFTGAENFFVPRNPPPFMQPDGTIEATSFYDTSILKSTLERFVDFDRINEGDVRFSIGAVNVRTGNFVYFDNQTYIIKPEHVMASGSLPPGFPATEIEGEFYWDGGLISNTPLQWVVDSDDRRDTLVFQVDLWSAIGNLPHNMTEVTTRQKEIQYSSRTRSATDQFKRIQSARCLVASLLEKLPKSMKDLEEVELLRKMADHKMYNIIQLIYRAKSYEGHSKDYDFSRLSMEEHWQSGYNDVRHTLCHPQVLELPKNQEGVFTFDFARESEQ